MAGKKKDRELEAELLATVEPKFPGMMVEVGLSERWNRPCVTFRWAGFADLLPEERYHRLATVIPESVREKKLKGFVWLELAPEESVDSFLKHPRSEDMADQEGEIYAGLVQCGFFDGLSKAVGPSPESKCRGVFQETLAVLQTKKYTPEQIRDARLAFIRHGAYCDCQVHIAARPSLAEAHAGAA